MNTIESDMCAADGHFRIYGNANVRQEGKLTYDLGHPLFIGDVARTEESSNGFGALWCSTVALGDWKTLSGVLCQTPHFFAAIACIKLNVLL